MTAPFEPGWQLLVGVTLPFGLGWLLLRRRGPILGLMLALAASTGIGAIAGKIRTELIATPMLKEEIGPVCIEGVVAEIDASERSRRIRIDVRAIERLTPEQTPEFVRFSCKGDIPFNPGRAVACKAILAPLPSPHGSPPTGRRLCLE
jgi:competence protein ComEC